MNCKQTKEIFQKKADSMVVTAHMCDLGIKFGERINKK